MTLNLRSMPFGAVVFAAALTVTSCGETANKQVKAGGGGNATANDGSDPSLNNPQQNASIDQRDVIDPKAALISASYYVEVKSLGIKACTGEVKLKVNANMGNANAANGAALLEIPEGSLDCGMLGPIDLTQILGSAAGASTVQPVMTVKNDVLHVSAIGAGVYSQDPAKDPGRPMFPSFIAGNKSSLENLNYTKQLTVISTMEGNKQAQGSVTLKMLYFNKLYESPHMKQKRPFPKTLDFEATTQGFEGINKILNMLFDRMEFRISLDPLAVPYISFKGKIADMMAAMPAGGAGGAGGIGGGLGGLLGGAGAGGGAGGLGGGLFGTLIKGLTKVISIEFEAHLVDQEGLSYKTVEEEDNHEEIGGKKTSGN